ncbi:MAG TPA: murein biosynthesis integral membrane protein MurJ, partial [Clostridia bacterium]|nr:murein biosynthesis integral membrane protein MurJ [Clostridia bacterium]
STILFAIIAGALNTIIIPLMSDIRENQGRENELVYVNNMVNIVILFTAALTLLGYFIAPFMIRILASGFRGETFDLAVKLTRVGLPVMIFNGFLCVMKGYLHVHGEFKVPAYEGFALSIPVILYLIFLTDVFGITGLMVVVTVSGLFRVLVYLPALFRNGYRFRPVVDPGNRDFKKTVVLLGPILIGIISGYINLAVDRTIASRLVEGSISALSYASRIQAVVSEILALTITTVVYTMIAGYITSNDDKELKKTIKFGFNVVVLIALPAAIGLIVLDYPVTKLLFQRGAFTEGDTLMTASALSFYSIGLVAAVVKDLTSKIYFAKQETKIPMIVSICSVVLNIILNLILSKSMGHNGLALATSTATVFSMTILLILLRKRILDIDLRQNMVDFAKALAAGLAMGGLVIIMRTFVFDTVNGSFVARGIRLVTIAGTGAVFYGLLLYAFRVEEVVVGTRKVIVRIGGMLKGNK